MLLIYLPVTITGFVAYGSNVEGNVLQSLPNGALRVAAEVFILVHVMCAFVINLNPFSLDMEELFNIPHSETQHSCLTILKKFCHKGPYDSRASSILNHSKICCAQAST